MLKHMVDYQGLDRGFHALADPSRRTMLARLTRGPASVSELAAPLDMSLTAVLQHVKVLEDAGLVVTGKQGRTRSCRLHAEQVRQLEGWLHEQRTAWERRLDRLDDVLARPDDTEEDD